MEIMKTPDYFIFAEDAKAGELFEYPDIKRGWGSTLDETQGKPPLEWMNGAFNRLDKNVLYLLQQGIPEWNGSVQYPVGAMIKHQDKLYLCLIENSNSKPSSNNERWELIIRNASEKDKGIIQIATQQEVNDGKNDLTAVTPLKLNETLKKIPNATPETITSESVNSITASGHTHEIEYPISSLEKKGIVQLTNIIDNSEDNAVTPKAIIDYIASLEPVEKIHIFHTKTTEPPDGYIVRNGQSIDPVKMPKLYAHYGKNMPDDRNRVYRMYGELAGEVGSTQEDAIRNIKGMVGWSLLTRESFSDGAISIKRNYYFYPISSGQKPIYSENNNSIINRSVYTEQAILFDASKIVPTAQENRVKSRIILACNKIQ